MLSPRAKRQHGDLDALEAELVALPDLPLDDLKVRWAELYRAPPPRRIGRPIMVRAVAYKLQEYVFGGFKPSVRRRLDRAAAELANGAPPRVQPASIKPGTRLLCEWHGVTHEVIVLETGVRYRGETWLSLTAVARAITGAHWSGPGFSG